ncbi:hypothetical protein B6U42_03700 [Ligilactobacillus salivarius]|nr:hypothetical protein B6U42_03700 [Ligilactobacillus salivarius]
MVSPQGSSSGPTAELDSGVAKFDPKGNVKPTDSNTIAEIKAYLDAHSISYSSSASKADLLKLVV